uniref:Protein FAM136A n=1 Tax=Minutocellus polymorphus TaxID=265543 RepID=A0A6U0IBM4_9STRA|mmetsp:Transcript_10352/g.17112  ORF Transcript_10352/g.17112 Transcript_10352/m.17112 type:complete len:154 (+) Transcript_10352:102-563(+)|eukprot:CAMPEP_0197720064 /NCGR_PEP_ID=MMETSP1434-20131217/3545_1 /TAXON_ID=265543 /ORGANISM="Minutocellus polymorphus, Strain CCMP3303" /LENGTH=153 /DNA_ID=CAMNT_0043304863 /DNA_START=60 /DNA_END=521 /DNA_ORIENTATION=+
MASPALQSQANALNARMEGEAKTAIDSIERELLRPLAQKSYECISKCYSKAGTTGSNEQLEHCSRSCQVVHQQAHAMLQQEINQFQNRLSRAMMQCNDEAQDMMTPDVQNNARKMKKIEDTVLNCISGVVQKNVGALKPMRERIESQIKSLGK